MQTTEAGKRYAGADLHGNNVFLSLISRPLRKQKPCTPIPIVASDTRGSRGGWHVQSGLAIVRKEMVMNKYTWMLGVMLACYFPALAQHSAVIESFDSTGQLTFKPMPNAASYRVEWALSANGPWTNFTGGTGQSLDHIAGGGTDPITVPVPMLYRVVATLLTSFAVSNSGTSAYMINGEFNPAMNLVRGRTYAIEVNSPGHPFWIKLFPTTETGNQYNEGLSANGIESGTILFSVPLDVPDTLYYICQFHSAMQGVIHISDEPGVPEGMVFVQGGSLPDIGNGALSVSTFYIDKHEVTQAQWNEVYFWAITNGYAFDNVGSSCASNHPVQTVNWYDVVKWCNARSQKEGLQPVYTVNGAVYKGGRSNDVVQTSAVGYRLPTDAEWEFAARGGTQSQGYEYSGGNDVGAVAWYGDNSGGAACNYGDSDRSTWPVGQKASNELGIHDMSGNVWEWCFEWYPGLEGYDRVFRGGSWDFGVDSCRVGLRAPHYPGTASTYIGFRAVLSPGQNSPASLSATRAHRPI